jgi:regulator of replication initiation timing
LLDEIRENSIHFKDISQRNTNQDTQIVNLNSQIILLQKENVLLKEENEKLKKELLSQKQTNYTRGKRRKEKTTWYCM